MARTTPSNESLRPPCVGLAFVSAGGRRRLQCSSFVTFVSRQAGTRHDIIMARHGRNRNLGEPVARPVPTSCSDLPRRPVWPAKSRHFVHTFCTNKLHLVATCRDGRYGRTTSGNLYTIWLRCVNILPAMSGRPNMVRQAYTICLHTFGTCLDAVPTTPCRDNHIMSYLCRTPASPAIQNGRNKVCRGVSWLVATRTSRMSCTVYLYNLLDGREIHDRYW